VFNNVLKKFSENAVKHDKINMKTQLSWVSSWWRSFMKRKYPEIERYSPHWDNMIVEVLKSQSNNDLKIELVDWGHIILDEGQDFPKGFYEFLHRVRSMLFHDIKPPSLTVLADENQRIKENGSTLKQIKDELNIDKNRIFYLSKNYRNTDPVNELINCFYVGLESGKTLPSGKKGDKPKMVTSNNFEATIRYMISYIIKHENEEILIIPHTEKGRQDYFNALNSRLDKKYFHIQTYTYKDRKSIDKMRFDHKGTVTVLNKQSCKGTEFDAVFILDLQDVDIATDNIHGFKMEMYVMCSRARNFLALMSENSSNERLPIMSYLPKEDEDILEYVNVK